MSHKIAESDKEKEVKKQGKICLNCIYFDPYPVQKQKDNTLGTCKANPPSPAPDYSNKRLGVWPNVLGSFWCGLFESEERKGE